MTKISGFIITYNEEKRIAKAINSLQNVVDEIIVIDSDSNDRTTQIAKDLGVKVVNNKWEGYVKQKIYGENLCKHDWIINIDADEELSESLQDEINYIFKSSIQDRYIAYKVRCLILHRLDKSPRAFAPYTECIRLYNKNFAKFANNKDVFSTRDSVILNSEIESNGKIYLLNEPVYHRSALSAWQLVDKANLYTNEQAMDIINSKSIPSPFRIALEMPVTFIKAFFIRRYFVFGFNGFIDSVIFAFSRFLRLAKARELKIMQDNKQEQR
ncbi:MAG: glycosyltransferase family 2 protein [Rickettsiaceae bacterium]